jgi:hypothetical protein
MIPAASLFIQSGNFFADLSEINLQLIVPDTDRNSICKAEAGREAALCEVINENDFSIRVNDPVFPHT